MLELMRNTPCSDVVAGFMRFSHLHLSHSRDETSNKTARAEAPGMAMPIWKSRGITSADPTRRLVAFA